MPTQVPTTPLVLAPQYLPQKIETKPAVVDDRSKVQQAIDKMNELISVQSKVDAAIDRLPPGSQRDRLIKTRDDNRGFTMTNIIIPAWNKIKSWMSGPTTASPMAGFEGELLESDGMGAIPLLIPAAIVAASAAILSVVGGNLYTEYKILNDPAISGTQKLEFAQGRTITSALTSVGGIAGQLKWIALIAAVGYGAYLLSKNKESVGAFISGLRKK